MFDQLVFTRRTLDNLALEFDAPALSAEDPSERAKRQRTLREWHSWTDTDGMIAGRYRFTPEVGGPIAKLIEANRQRIFRAHKAGIEHEPHAAYAADAVAGLILGDETG